MGSAPSTGPMSPALIRRVFDRTNAFKASRGSLKGVDGDGPGCDALAAYQIIGGNGKRIAAAEHKLNQVCDAAEAASSRPPKKRAGSGDAKSAEEIATRTLDRCLGCMLGNVVGDALGAPLEFSAVRYNEAELKGMCHDEIWNKDGYNSFSLKPGQWTDDAAMGLCIADSLICCDGFDGIDLRQRFHLWNRYGYNNAFGRDSTRHSRGSVGLGGNISMSMDEWEQEGERTPATNQGDQFTSGNGSVMRNGAMPVWFRNDIEKGMSAAYGQSKTTHRGDEAAELCRLLTFICTKFINGAGRELLKDLSEFKTPLYTVECLAKAECEEKHPHNSNPVFGGLENRRWDWQTVDHRYCAKRAADSPGYIGSYAMDAMCMALHCLWSTNTFEQATLMAANLRGDSDSVCAVVGQLAGALYGASSIPSSWLQRVRRWDGGSILARAVMLHDRSVLSHDEALSDAACASAQNLGQDIKEVEHYEVEI